MAAVGPDKLDVNGVVYNVSQVFYNGTAFNASYCTPETCSLLIGTYRYLPNVPGRAFFAAIFGLLLAINVPLGIYYRTWGVMVGMVFGLGLEVAGYVARIMIHNNDFNRNPFPIYIYCVALGPSFLSAAIYLCLARIVVVYGESNSRLKPRTYSISFMVGDSSPSPCKAPAAVVSLRFFAIVCADFAWRVHRCKGSPNPSFEALRLSSKWAGFLMGQPSPPLAPPPPTSTLQPGLLAHILSFDTYSQAYVLTLFSFNAALAIATVAIYVRSVYRIAELQAGFHSDLANQEALFMVLDGTVITIATAGLTAFHLGLVFGYQWRGADFTLKGTAPLKDTPSRSKSTVPIVREEQAIEYIDLRFSRLFGRVIV